MPSAIDQALSSIIARAASEIAAAVRANMTAEISSAMKARGAARQPQRAAAAARKPAAQPTRKARGARTTVDSELAGKVLALLAKSPGLRAEEVTARLGAKPDPVKAALAALKQAGKLTTTGQARGTRYSAR